MLVDTNWAKQKYDEYSQKYFGGDMPAISFKIGRSLNRFGEAMCRTIIEDNKPKCVDFILKISNAYDSPENLKVDTLLHEMIHIYDFYHYPEHFAIYRNGQLYNNRRYDAHGNELFLPMANRINQYGHDITKTVSKEQREGSKYSEETRKRMEKPFYLCYAQYMKEGWENIMFLCTPNTFNNIVMHYWKEANKKFAPSTLEAYFISNPELREQYVMTKGELIRGYKYSYDKWFALLDYLGLSTTTPSETINFEDMELWESKSQNKKIIRLTESDLRKIISETLNELRKMNGNGNEGEPVDGGNAVAKSVTPTSMVISVI